MVFLRDSVAEYVAVTTSDESVARVLHCGRRQSRVMQRVPSASRLVGEKRRQSCSTWDDLTSSEFTIDEVDFAEVSPSKKYDGLYMAKRLRKDWYNCDRKAAMGLASEVELLTKVQHLNILSVKATIGVRGTGTFGFVSERITSSLGESMAVWKGEYKDAKGLLGFKNDFTALESLVSKRYTVLYGIANGLRFLHSREILFRGLCQNSCGLGASGVTKIFDFSCAKQISCGSIDDDFKHTAMTGEHPYMAREVATGNLYGASADIYSFAVLFWEVMALKKAKKHFCRSDPTGQVAVKSLPRLRFLSKELCQLMTRACLPEGDERPDLEDICDHLETAIMCGK